jgi:hypothetical protein
MKPFSLLAMAGLLAGAVTVPATQDTYINSVAVTIPPQVDATNFVNTTAGSFTINTRLPFETSNTRNFTNRGSMTGSVGWRFDHAPSGPGLRRAAANFHNHPLGTVTAVDGFTVGGPGGIGLEYASKLLIAATNIVNQGILTVGELGLMRLDGTNVNLNRGGLQVNPLIGQGVTESVDGSTFQPEVAIADIYWGIGNRAFLSAPIVTFFGTNVQGVSPTHPVTTPTGGGNTIAIASPARSFVYTNAGLPISLTLTNDTGGTTNILVTTNRFVQVALISVVDTNFGVLTSFTPSEIDTNPFSTITVQLSAPLNNQVTAQDSAMTFYVMDRLASTTNRNLSSNLRDYPPTFRPVTHLVSRVAPIEFLSGTGPNAVLLSNTVYGPQMVTNRVEAEFAAYSVSANYLSQLQPPVVDASITNIPGRIEINAGTLDMGRTRLRSDGLVTIRAKDFLNSTNASMDAWNLAFDLNSASGNLRVQDLARTEVTRYGGTMTMWSGLWENIINEVYTNNYAPDTTDTNLFVQSPLTNVVTIGIHVFILDASGLASQVPVTTHSFVARNTNHLVLANPLSIGDTFTIAAERFTMDGTNGSLFFGDSNGLIAGLPPSLLQSFTAVNAPNLMYFTNGGTFYVPNEGHFGDDRPLPYKAFVNRGGIFGTGLFIDSEYFENSGLLDSFSSLTIETTSGRMEVSDTLVNGDLNISAYDFKWRDHFNQTLGALNVLITNSLSDNGAVSPSRFVCGDGFHFAYANPALPPSGDLLGTSLETAAPIFSSTDHTWPAADRGATAAGYTNNLALGRLVLSIGFDAEVVFNGTTTSNAIYVDYLEFLGIDLADVELALRAGPNFVIYFADSNLPAEELNGLLGGRLKWVSDFAGPNSSVDLLVGNQVIKVNRALRNSLIIDSDGDGLANGFDPSPFDPPVVNITLATAAPLTLAVSWQAAAQTTYKVEYTTNQKDWVLLESYTNQTATAAPATVLDQVPPGSPQRYYRVGYKP